MLGKCKHLQLYNYGIIQFFSVSLFCSKVITNIHIFHIILHSENCSECMPFTMFPLRFYAIKIPTGTQ